MLINFFYKSRKDDTEIVKIFPSSGDIQEYFVYEKYLHHYSRINDQDPVLLLIYRPCLYLLLFPSKYMLNHI